VLITFCDGKKTHTLTHIWPYFELHPRSRKIHLCGATMVKITIVSQLTFDSASLPKKPPIELYWCIGTIFFNKQFFPIEIYFGGWILAWLFEKWLKKSRAKRAKYHVKELSITLGCPKKSYITRVSNSNRVFGCEGAWWGLPIPWHHGIKIFHWHAQIVHDFAKVKMVLQKKRIVFAFRRLILGETRGGTMESDLLGRPYLARK
jgi:hypothetical protein